jgi:hypothetical protein
MLRLTPVSFSIGVYFVVSQSWCGVSWLLSEFLRVQVSLCVVSFFTYLSYTNLFLTKYS